MRLIQFIIEKSKNVRTISRDDFLTRLFKKPKWQYYPVIILFVFYMFFIFLAFLNILPITTRTIRWAIGSTIVIISVTVFLNYAFPVDNLPIPSGKSLVGTKIYELKDETRSEIYTDLKGVKRKIKYQIWYPVDKVENFNKAKWITNGTILTRKLAVSMQAPAFILDQIAEIDSNSYLNAPISNKLKTHPIVIISHGWKGFRELHTDFAEELASNGYIVISIDHTYGAQAVVFENGEIAYLNRKALPKLIKPSQFSDYAKNLAMTYGNDVISVLNDLVELNKSKAFKSKLDLESIGLLGHSTGGAGDVYASIKDDRIKAIIGLDAWVNALDSNLMKKGLKIPALFLRSEQWDRKPNNKALKTLINNSNQAALFQLDKTKHVDFAMTYMISPFTKHVGFTGQLGGRQSSTIQKQFIIDFFDKNLKKDCSIKR